jgi:hypothetical protein
MGFQPELIHESIEDALRDAVRSAGGSKKVGPMLWPAKPQKEAENRVNDCINPNRDDKFSLAELLFVLRLAREAGYHGAMQFIAAECGYRSPEPLEPQDEQARLMRDFIEATKMQQKIAARLERLAISPSVKAVA